MSPFRLLILVLVLSGTCAVKAAQLEFNRDVRPILSARCFQCHGPDAQNRQANLRLDLRADALQGGDSGPAISLEDPQKSLLLARVSTADPDQRMPPVDHGPALTESEISVLRQWIASGAEYQSHWAFLPIVAPEIPSIEPTEVAHQPLDHFVLQRLRQQGLTASPEADKRTLLRRVYLDLIGLLPSPAEAARFAADTRPEAYAEVVDGLLNNPHYGERWGRHWLDQARYADSNGYTIDADRIMWPYRDWVIQALNRDMPFDQFTIEQLAGDLLPDATRSQRIATGFHRNTLINQEGGTDPEQFRIEAVMDRVATTGAVWLGLTVGCAQCHSHKYDPISQREYYELFAFFNNTRDVNNTGPTVDVHEGELYLNPEPSTAAGHASRQPTLHDLEQAAVEVQQLVAGKAERRRQWEEALRSQSESAPEDQEAAWQTLKVASAKAEQAQFTLLDDHSILATPGIPRETYLIETEALPAGTPIGSFRLRFLTHPSLPQQGPGLATNGNLVLSAVEVYQGAERLTLISASADHAQKDYPVAALIDEDPGTAWAINVEPGSQAVMNADHTVLLLLGSPLKSDGSPLRFVLKHELNNDFNVGRVQFSLSDKILNPLADPVFREALQLAESARTADQTKLVELKFDAADQPLRHARRRLEELRLSLRLGPTVKSMVMDELAEPRETYLLTRGDFLQPDKASGPILPNVPRALPPLSADAEGERRYTRLDFARWLVSPDHPLTARVTVNRVWMHYFGRPLVETENDFGSQGALPSHPELLDYLARQLIDNGWSLKSLHRTIVLSATYRQASQVRAESATVDPLNILLSRQQRIRVDAEIIRDVALQAAGKLSEHIGGPSVHPPQPDGVYAFTQNKKVWQTSQGEARYRRGMYTMFYRSAPYPGLSTFDVPDFQSVCTRRQRSNTPLQALTMANDTVFVELARELAGAIIAEFPRTNVDFIEQRVQTLFERTVARPPTATEATHIVDYVRGVPSEGSEELAVWTTVARAVLNTDEFVTRE